MADDITYTSSSPAGVANGTKQVTDEHVTRGHMPLVKLAYSADGDATPVTASSAGLLIQAQGQTGHDAADNGSPVKIGGKARTADQTAVSQNDRTDSVFDTLGHILVRPYALHENLVQGVTAAITNTTDTSVIAAAGAGIRNYVTSLTVTNSHATVSTVVELKDGTTVIHRGYALAAGGGYTITFPTPLRGTANTAINAACVTTGSNVYVSASGYRAAV